MERQLDELKEENERLRHELHASEKKYQVQCTDEISVYRVQVSP